ncbi:KH domain-containing protein [Patescibacteria group bacterium]|nr:KH domain-containing protein [Patescibacteria group bacterium]
MSADVAESQLAELLKKLGVNATVKARDDSTLDIETEDPSELIGHHGEVIDALQHVLRVILHRNDQEAGFIVDVDGYRVKQHQKLQELAKEKATQVLETGEPATLPPMTSFERRLVHVELKEIDGVETESLGDGQGRRVMIKKQG